MPVMVVMASLVQSGAKTAPRDRDAPVELHQKKHQEGDHEEQLEHIRQNHDHVRQPEEADAASCWWLAHGGGASRAQPVEHAHRPLGSGRNGRTHSEVGLLGSLGVDSVRSGAHVQPWTRGPRPAMEQLRILHQAFVEGLITAGEYKEHEQIVLCGQPTGQVSGILMPKRRGGDDHCASCRPSCGGMRAQLE